MKYPHYTDNGRVGVPVVVFLGSLGTTLSMWDPQLRAFATDHRTIAIDLPGHGGTPVPAHPCTTAAFAADVVQLLDVIGVDEFAVVGLSFGGAIVQVLAATQAERVTSAVIACAAPSYDSDFRHARARLVRTHGLSEIVRRSALRRFAPGFDDREPDTYAASLLMLSTMSPHGYAACCEALATHDAERLLPDIAVPTLVLAGERDQVTPPELVREMARAIPGSTLRLITGCGHLANVEKPVPFTTLVREHFTDTIDRQLRCAAERNSSTTSPLRPRQDRRGSYQRM
ncbi:3-oxoadipate enol-lactonase / 4-carboxymuconolactone decarboxylase [Nocardia amikacinitolerans]|uniref:alpha/beta fold hydrolase n=1 Tax=Nocardia amikacinitolerans TaxID=756689 RepID=UPI0008338B86|nr:alpha/beta fold hydrolase [Nocardia amikacinitolerans]MCP2321240.1 3-oxoadipate enol-lactonase / 4-carboxymuconolactone decarboxylase [Nocardia amikacinitolerans]